MLPSPLIFGGNVARLNNDAWTLALLTNEEVMGVSQDAMGARGVRKTITGGELWVRTLGGGKKAFAFFNRGTKDATMSATFTDLGVTGQQLVRDLWHRADVMAPNDTISVSVPTVDLRPPRLVRCSMATVGGMPKIASTSGREATCTNWRA